MARPLRIDVENGWYHVTARGQNRQAMYNEARDYTEFLSRLEELNNRYGLEVHAYVLMPNHYHLLVRTPRANLSEAMQWLNNGYGMWRNRRHGLTGHVFQGRFKSILVEGAGWLLELSRYLHFNPVAVKGLGWGKAEKAAERKGLRSATPEVIAARLEVLRRYRWSSYRAYAGYEAAPEWLYRQEVLKRVEGGGDGYRREVEDRLTQSQPEELWSKLRWGVVLGGAKYAESVRERARVVRETQGRSALRREIYWLEVVRAVERVKGERWSDFVDRYGDWGRELAFWVGRRRCGMTLQELGAEAGGADYSAVSESIRHFERHTLSKPAVQAARAKVCKYLKLET